MDNQAVAYLIITNKSKDVVGNMEINVSNSNDLQVIN